uniref:Uncharacterized protein n=1 Tax=Rhizophora mucronata TaxID=61149 RepID=A0A2P2JUW1_RHIMU
MVFMVFREPILFQSRFSLQRTMLII